MATFPVKYFHSAMRGAPALSGTAGTLVALLDACLLTGFGQVTLTSLVVSGGVATATVSAGDTFDEYAVILIDGATPAGLNGEQRVLSSTSTTFTFATTAPDGTATGTITAKYAPVGGWEKEFSGTNKAVYKSIDPQANGHALRVDDSSGQYAAVSGYVSMTDVDSGTGPFPTTAQFSAGGFWSKSAAASSTAVGWRAFADPRAFLLSIAVGSYSSATYVSSPAIGFGDPIPIKAGGDPWCTFLSVQKNIYMNTRSCSLDNALGTADGYAAICAPRAPDGLGSGVLMVPRSMSGARTGSGISGDDTGGFGSFASALDGHLRLAQMMLQGSADQSPARAYLPGLYFVPQSGAGTSFTAGSFIDGTGELAGRRLMAVKTSDSQVTELVTGVYFIDVTGPWR